MANVELKTRLQLKYDSYDEWVRNDPVLFAGEVAVAYVPTKIPESANTNVTDGGVSVQRTTPPHILIKVGDGTRKFSELQFVSGLAADVNGYAKMTEANFQAAVKALSSAQFATDIADYAQAISGLEELVGTTTVANQISAAIETALTGLATTDEVTAAVKTVSDKIGVVPKNGNDDQTVVQYIDAKTADLATSSEVGELSDAIDTVSGKVAALIGDDTDKTIREIAIAEITATLVDENAQASYDTLAEMAAWIQAHPENAAAMNVAITALQEKLVLGTYTEGTGESATTKEYSTVKEYVEAYVTDSVDSVTDRVSAIETRFGASTDILVFNCGNSQIDTQNEYN